jgi:predicted dehydrogenase
MGAGTSEDGSEGPGIRFAIVGLDHLHAFSQVQALVSAGAELAAIVPGDAPLAELVDRAHPGADRGRTFEEVLEDESIQVIATAAVPDQRCDLAVAAMEHGKDVLVDKPGAVDLDQLERIRRVQAATGRRWAVFFSERIESPATEHALELVRGGAIGRPIQTIGLGPHRHGSGRPDWFYDPSRSGGILGDLASHQVDQFLMFTGESDARVEHALTANHAHPEHPHFEDFGELLLRGRSATGYVRVDWFTPDGLPTWGDVRLTVLGTEGTLEVRKNVDLAGRDAGEHLFLVDGDGVRHIDCREMPRPFARAWLRDVREGSDVALPSAHCLRASEIALRAQQSATRLQQGVGDDTLS